MVAPSAERDAVAIIQTALGMLEAADVPSPALLPENGALLASQQRCRTLLQLRLLSRSPRCFDLDQDSRSVSGEL
jgi:hypothetical protein